MFITESLATLVAQNLFKREVNSIPMNIGL